MTSSKLCALIIPYAPPVLAPGTKAWDEITAPVRRNSRVHVFALIEGHGIIPEATLVNHPEYVVGAMEREEELSMSQGVVHARAWLQTYGPLYARIVVVRFDPDLMRMWSTAVRGSSVDQRVRIIKPSTHERGLLSQAFLGRVHSQVAV